MARFEDAIQWIINGGRARRRCWAHVVEYTQETPPLAYERRWRIWLSDSSDTIVQGWGGQIGGDIEGPVRDGAGYKASDGDRIADDWELFEKPIKK